MVSNPIVSSAQDSKDLSPILTQPIVFISDLHFDYTKKEYKPEYSSKMKDNFILFIKENYSDSIICLAGDYFDNFKHTLSFIDELENNKILGFCVLGNHDYWNDGKLSHEDIIHIFDINTINNKYFKLLITGRKYHLHDLCIIGDTGWTSFKRTRRKNISLKRFMKLPEAKETKDFHPEKIIAFHNEWITFANKTLLEEKKVLIVTHFPMIDFTKTNEDCWWSSLTELRGDNSWRIFGHTHHTKEQSYNNISSQCGYNNRGEKDLKQGNQYTSDAFGRLERKFIQNESETISHFYSPLICSNAKSDVSLIAFVNKRGYKRCMANNINFSALANNPTEYLEKVRETINRYTKYAYIGYAPTEVGGLPLPAENAIYASIDILEDSIFNGIQDIRAFITAAVITGYVYNDMLYKIGGMRLLDDYDIIRFWLVLLTIRKFNLKMNDIGSIIKNREKSIPFLGVDIHLPMVNDSLSLSMDDVQNLLQKNPLLPKPQTILEENAHTSEDKTIYSACIDCGQEIIIDFLGNPDTCNDYGKIKAECSSCGKRNFIEIGSGISLARIRSGAKLKDKYSSIKLI